MSKTVPGDRLNRNPPARQTARLAVTPLGSHAVPNVTTVHAVHRGPDGFIPLARKQDGNWEPLGAMSVTEPWLPELLAELDADAYFGLNTDYRPARRRRELPVAHEREVYVPAVVEGQQVEVLETREVRPRVSPVTRLPHAHHTTDNLRWLNVCHVDIDCYERGLSVGEALGRIVDLQDRGQLPPATGFARSGRGLWAFWFLLDLKNPRRGEREVYGVRHTPTTPQRASKRALALYARVQRALADRLLPLGADLGALDAARFAPVPGSVKTATGQRVEWWLQVASNGRGFAYTLGELAQGLGLELAAHAHPVLEAALPDAPEGQGKDERLAAAGKRGWLVRWRNTLADFELLVRLRGGGFNAGIRNRGAYFYALLLLRAGMDERDVADHVARFGERCRPPLAAREVAGAVRQARRPKARVLGFLANATVYHELLVTPQEATYLRHLRPATSAPRRPKPPTPAERRATIRQVVANLRHVPPTRDMAQYLRSHGYECNHSTVALDYKALGLVTDKPQGGRPQRLPLT